MSQVITESKRRPQLGEQVAVRHRTKLNKAGHVDLDKVGDTEYKTITGVYIEPNVVRLSSGETWKVQLTDKGRSPWETVA